MYYKEDDRRKTVSTDKGKSILLVVPMNAYKPIYIKKSNGIIIFMTNLEIRNSELMLLVTDRPKRVICSSVSFINMYITVVGVTSCETCVVK
jgi:hypothetical protein